MVMLSDQPMRSSLQVAPLTIQKASRSDSIDNGSSAATRALRCTTKSPR